MSELKVNKITPKTGTSIQLGESGDTITIPAGATLTNNGTATGFGLSFCTTAKTSPFTATAGKGFLINTGSAVTVTLPASPSAGDEVIIVDQTGQAATNNITLGRNGSKIKGGCIDATIETNRAGLRLVYSGSSQGWITATAGNDATATTDKYIVASGGTVTTTGNFKVHTFNSDATFTVTCAGNSAGSNTVSYVVVAGGGTGGGNDHGGGGGAGGYREGLGVNDSYTGSPLRSPTGVPVSAQAYPVTVGAGGTAGSAPTGFRGNNGSPSVFSSITSAGGGGGGSNHPAGPGAVARNGIAGGSGGGGAGISGQPDGVGGAGNTPPVSPPQGFDGGDGDYNGNPKYTTGGGGGATAVGADASGPQAGNGAAGVASSITGSPVTRAGGGGGSTYPGGTNGTGGAGGGGAGVTNTTVNPGTVNTGGGGGGISQACSTSGGLGGSGVVIIRYKYQ